MSLNDDFAPVLLTAAVALVLSIVPLPFWIAIILPAFLVLVVVYWSSMAPHVAGVTLAFFAGLTLDVFQGSLLGQHAFALALVSYLAIRFHLQMRAKPLFEQCIYCFAALLLYELVLWSIDGWSGHGAGGAWRWVYTLPSAMIWPLIAGVLGRFHAPR
jgi:rod shape-determining protein MreD